MFAVLNWLFAVAFALSAAVQYNDPDPVGWMLVYGAAALACLTFGRLRADVWLTALVLAASAAWAAVWLPRAVATPGFGSVLRSMQSPNDGVEMTRELFGLVLVSGWMGVLLWRERRERASRGSG